MDAYINRAIELLDTFENPTDKMMILASWRDLYKKIVNNAFRYSNELAKLSANILLMALEFTLTKAEMLENKTSYLPFMKNFVSIISFQDEIIKVPENKMLLKTTSKNLEQYYIDKPYVDIIDKKVNDFLNKAQILEITETILDTSYMNLLYNYDMVNALYLKREITNKLVLILPSILKESNDLMEYRQKLKINLKTIIDDLVEEGIINLLPDKCMDVIKVLNDKELKIYLLLKKYYLSGYLVNDFDFNNELYSICEKLNLSTKDYLNTKNSLEKKLVKAINVNGS